MTRRLGQVPASTCLATFLLPPALPAARQVVINDLKAPIPPYFELFKVHHAINGDAEVFYREVATNPDFNLCREVRAGRVVAALVLVAVHRDQRNARCEERLSTASSQGSRKRHVGAQRLGVIQRFALILTCAVLGRLAHPGPGPCSRVPLPWRFASVWEPTKLVAIAFGVPHVSLAQGTSCQHVACPRAPCPSPGQAIDFLVSEIKQVEAKLANYLQQNLPMQVGGYGTSCKLGTERKHPTGIQGCQLPAAGPAACSIAQGEEMDTRV